MAEQRGRLPPRQEVPLYRPLVGDPARRLTTWHVWSVNVPQTQEPSTPMAYENILYETDGRLATITLTHPEKLNALSNELRGEHFHAMK